MFGSGVLDKKIRTMCFDRDDWACRHCHNRNGIDPHHIVSKGRGGKDVLENLVCICRICHSAHHDGHLKIELIDGEVKFIRIRGWKP
jgi:5-methylcytosine-specific restriction endonuclease McrA